MFALSLCAVSQAAVAQSSLIDGQVTKVDQSAGKITIKHGPIKKLGMDEGMTMVYKARGRFSYCSVCPYRRGVGSCRRPIPFHLFCRGRLMTEEVDKWVKVIRAAHIKAE
jgi:Copper binding periplasmic protein CusF